MTPALDYTPPPLSQILTQPALRWLDEATARGDVAPGPAGLCLRLQTGGAGVPGRQCAGASGAPAPHPRHGLTSPNWNRSLCLPETCSSAPDEVKNILQRLVWSPGSHTAQLPQSPTGRLPVPRALTEGTPREPPNPGRRRATPPVPWESRGRDSLAVFRLQSCDSQLSGNPSRPRDSRAAEPPGWARSPYALPGPQQEGQKPRSYLPVSSPASPPGRAAGQG